MEWPIKLFEERKRNKKQKIKLYENMKLLRDSKVKITSFVFEISFVIIRCFLFSADDAKMVFDT